LIISFIPVLVLQLYYTISNILSGIVAEMGDISRFDDVKEI